MADIVEHILSLSKASGSLSKEQLRDCAQLAEITKEVCRLSFQDIVEEACGMPLFRQSSCDGTPGKTKKVMVLCLPLASGGSTSRAASESFELLITISFLRYTDSLGNTRTKAWLHDPQPLSKGKKVTAIVAASLRIWRSCKGNGSSWTLSGGIRS